MKKSQKTTHKAKKTKRNKAAATPNTAGNPLPFGRFVKGAIKLVKKGGKTLVQFAR